MPARPRFEGLHRGIAGAARTDLNGTLRIEVTAHSDPTDRDEEIRGLEREYRAVVEEILELRQAGDGIRAFLRSISEPGALADTAGYSPDLSYEQKVELLETLDVRERLARSVALQRERLAELQVRSRIRDDVQSGAEKQQREYFLRKQLESIQKELGEDDASVADEYRAKIEDSGMPDDVREHAEREIARLERMGDSSGESSMLRTYLDWLVCGPVGRALRRAARPGRTPARSSTPTTPASTTSRSGSPSTSRSASCAPSAASPRTARPPGRSSP